MSVKEDVNTACRQKRAGFSSSFPIKVHMTQTASAQNTMNKVIWMIVVLPGLAAFVNIIQGIFNPSVIPGSLTTVLFS